MMQGGENSREEASEAKKSDVQREKERLQREYDQTINNAYLPAHLKLHFLKLDELKALKKMHYSRRDYTKALETDALIKLISWEASIIYSYVSKNINTDSGEDEDIDDLVEDLDKELEDARECARIICHSSIP